MIKTQGHKPREPGPAISTKPHKHVLQCQNITDSLELLD